MRKTIKVAPGVRMTFSKSGVSASAGVKGARVTRRADGRTQTTVGIPRSGVSYTSTSSSGAARRPRPAAPRAASSQHVAPTLPAKVNKPGLTAPRAEKDLFKAIQATDWNGIEVVASQRAEVSPVAATIAGVHRAVLGDNDRARQLLEYVWQAGVDPAASAFVRDFVRARFTIQVVPGAEAELPLGRDIVGLTLAEIYQDQGYRDHAIAVVEALEPTTFAALSLAELYCETGRWDEITSLTNGLVNNDDATSLLCTFRGIAFVNKQMFEAARASFKEALKSKSRSAPVRHRAWLERSRCYLAEGKKGMARKDLERILAEDTTYPGASEMFAALSA